MKKAAPTKDKTTKKTPKNKKKIIIISAIVSLVVVIGGCLLGFAIWREETKPVLIDELTFEINSEIMSSSLLLDGYEIIDEENIKTDELGEHEYTIKYRKGGREKELTFSYSIVDTTAPEIVADDTIEITEGEEIDLTSKATVKDNSKEDLKAKIEGEYDISKVGEYSLKFIAEDSSENKNEKAFTLKVNAKPEEKASMSGSTGGYSGGGSYSGSSYSAASGPSGDTYQEPAECKTFSKYQIVSEQYWTACRSVSIRRTTFNWYITSIDHGEQTAIWVAISDSTKTQGAVEAAKAYMPAPPTNGRAAYDYAMAHDGINTEYGYTTLYVVW